jgi:hypothetical protein
MAGGITTCHIKGQGICGGGLFMLTGSMRWRQSLFRYLH